MLCKKQDKHIKDKAVLLPGQCKLQTIETTVHLPEWLKRLAAPSFDMFGEQVETMYWWECKIL